MADREGTEAGQGGPVRRPPGATASGRPAEPVSFDDHPQDEGANGAPAAGQRAAAAFDDLLEKVFSVGLVLTDVHRLPPSAGLATYEVRVAGDLGEPLLRYLRWFHYTVPEQTLVRLTVAQADLHGFLRACTESGVRIERVRRVHAPTATAES